MALVRHFLALGIVGMACMASLPWAAAIASDEATTAPSAQRASPEAIVDAQLAAYNRRDLEGFLEFYSDDAVIENHPGQVTQAGKAEMRKRYGVRFANPDLHAEIIERITLGRFVIDHERVVAAPPANGTLEAVAIYEISGGKIVRVTFLKD